MFPISSLKSTRRAQIRTEGKLVTEWTFFATQELCFPGSAVEKGGRPVGWEAWNWGGCLVRVQLSSSRLTLVTHLPLDPQIEADPSAPQRDKCTVQPGRRELIHRITAGFCRLYDQTPRECAWEWILRVCNEEGRSIY